nr:MAG TPA: hypothetical protein [Caudoviricetes sp.]DAU59301.1 MAG TPA: hypothetical protein [Crassvirales sp.]
MYYILLKVKVILLELLNYLIDYLEKLNVLILRN